MALTKEKYDPHVLYHAINITAEMEYKIPMTQIYSLLEKSNALDKGITTDAIVELLNKLSCGIESNAINDSTGEEFQEDTPLAEKIKNLLRMLGCDLTVQELNKILSGEIKIETVLSKDAQTAWNLFFDKNKKGNFVPSKVIVDQIIDDIKRIAIENVEREIEKIQTQELQHARQNSALILERYEDAKGKRSIITEPTLQDLEQKRIKLRLYIAHMQGYDKDWDRDGNIGIDKNTGYVIDYGDIYISDKQHGTIYEDYENDGIDRDDFK